MPHRLGKESGIPLTVILADDRNHDKEALPINEAVVDTSVASGHSQK